MGHDAEGRFQRAIHDEISIPLHSVLIDLQINIIFILGMLSSFFDDIIIQGILSQISNDIFFGNLVLFYRPSIAFHANEDQTILYTKYCF